MESGIYVALINPGIALIFSATFLLLWHHQRNTRYILLLCASFLAISVGFLLQYFTLHDPEFSRLVSNLLFLAGGVGLAIGSLWRYERTMPLQTIGVVGLVGFAAFIWFLYVDPSITLRIYAINFTFGAITLLVAAELRFVANKKLIDNILFGLTAFWGLSFFVRPILVLWIDGPYENYAQYHQSLYWYTLTLSSALFLLLIALSIICAIALDVMEKLRLESQTDPLSGLLNRRGFEEQGEEALHQQRRRAMPVSIVVCDLDHFKSINDSHGHAVGDEVIRSFAACLRTAAGPDHIVGRVGGEEFSVLLRGATLGTARLFAEGVRTTFGTLPMEGLPAALRTTASFGVATWRDGETINDLFIRADDALYEAKKAGRDRVRINGDAASDGIAAGA
ncbi:GGDEF domain-containing protein [Mesorhizobium sp. CAU 1741]|uniref:GGDEF domain-containing protein n=1 Tax=Mesorhizobium sp. CAU 1741 TaxID=3140366 RepID=UPI00325AD132